MSATGLEYPFYLPLDCILTVCLITYYPATSVLNTCMQLKIPPQKTLANAFCGFQAVEGVLMLCFNTSEPPLLSDVMLLLLSPSPLVCHCIDQCSAWNHCHFTATPPAIKGKYHSVRMLVVRHSCDP